MTGDCDDRCAFLRPWCDAVRGKLRIDPQVHLEQRKPESKHITVIFSLPCSDELSTASEMRAIRDALLLLSLVSRADAKGWSHVMKTFCNVEANLDPLLDWLDDGTIDMLRFALEFSDAFSGSSAQTNYLRELFLQPEANATKDQLLVETIRQILTQVAPGGRLTRASRVDIPIVIYFAAASTQDEEWWIDFMKIREENGNWRFQICLPQCEGVGLDCAFVPQLLPSFVVQLDGNHKILQVMEQIATDSGGLTIPLLHFEVEGQIDKSDDEEEYEVYDEINEGGNDEIETNEVDSQIQALGRLYERVLCANNTNSAQAIPQLQEISICATLQTPDEFFRLCSGIAACQRTSKLRFLMDQLQIDAEDRPVYSDDCEYIPDQRRYRRSSNSDLSDFEEEEIDVSAIRARKKAWESMAYALFSTFARTHSTITSVELGLDAMMECDIADFAEVLDSINSAKVICQRCDEEECDTNSTILKQGTTLKLNNQDTGGLSGVSAIAASWELEHDICGVRVVENRSEDAVVIVPGYGICVVAKSALPPTGLPRPDVKPISELSLCFETVQHADCAGIPGFLQRIGTPLTYLSIDACIGRFTSLPAIISSCPNLKTLIVRNCTVSVSAFLEAYSLNQVRLNDLECHFDNTNSLMEELSDSTKSLAQTLKGLTCHSEFEGYEGVRTIARMFLSNNVLEYLHLRLRLRLRSEVYVDVYSLVDEFHKKRLADKQVPLPMKSRLAFLSIFSAQKHSGSERELKRARQSGGLESLGLLSSMPICREAFETIFAFAASCVYRRVYVTQSVVRDSQNPSPPYFFS